MSIGHFISIEGPDGSGKSTQISILKKHIEELGYEVVLTREPGGTIIGEQIRSIILNPEHKEMDSMTEALLYAASRSQHVAQVIKPALQRGCVVICDRFVDSSIAYQGYGRGLGEPVKVINDYAIGGCMPELTLLLKLDPGVGTGRIKEGERDRLEQEKLDFHKTVFDGYLEIEKKFPDRVKGIDAGRTIEEISSDVIRYVDELLK